MKLRFLGTRGFIDPKTKKHTNHSSLLLINNNKKVMIDCGETFLNKLNKINPNHIVITHAHPDHAFGLKKGCRCYVWATKSTWENLKNFPIPKKYKKTIFLRKKQKIAGITFEAFDVIHSIKAPACGYKISCKEKCFFYVPDVVWINDRTNAFKDIDFYIGDGATIQRNMIRKDKKTNHLFGHANIMQQLTWCQKEKVKMMIITHLGSDIVKNEKKAIKIIKKIASKKNVEVIIAYDGFKIN